MNHWRSLIRRLISLLLALYFHYGRDRLISSSRPGSKLGEFAGHLELPGVSLLCSSTWTSNINVHKITIGLGKTCNLSDCAGPLFDLIGRS